MKNYFWISFCLVLYGAISNSWALEKIIAESETVINYVENADGSICAAVLQTKNEYRINMYCRRGALLKRLCVCSIPSMRAMQSGNELLQEKPSDAILKTVDDALGPDVCFLGSDVFLIRDKRKVVAYKLFRDTMDLCTVSELNDAFAEHAMAPLKMVGSKDGSEVFFIQENKFFILDNGGSLKSFGENMLANPGQNIHVVIDASGSKTGLTLLYADSNLRQKFCTFSKGVLQIQDATGPIYRIEKHGDYYFSLRPDGVCCIQSLNEGFLKNDSYVAVPGLRHLGYWDFKIDEDKLYILGIYDEGMGVSAWDISSKKCLANIPAISKSHCKLAITNLSVCLLAGNIVYRIFPTATKSSTRGNSAISERKLLQLD